MHSTRRPCRKFVSETFCDSEGWLPVGAVLICGWTISGASFITSLWILPYNSATALVILFLTSVLVSLLWSRTKKLAMQSSFRYELLLTETEAILYTYDIVDRRHMVRSVRLRDVTSAEFFVAGEFANLALITPDRNLEIPLWTFGTSRKLILQSLKAHGVRLVHIGGAVPKAAA